MKKFLIAAAASLLIFGGQSDASATEDLNAQVEMQDMKSHGKWAHFRDKYILGRETENEYRDRKDWERRHRDDYYRRHRERRYYDDDYYYDPPPRYRYPPPPPRRGYDYPPPPPLR